VTSLTRSGDARRAATPDEVTSITVVRQSWLWARNCADAGVLRQERKVFIFCTDFFWLRPLL